MNERLTQFVEENKKLFDEQIGYKKAKSTVYYIFVLQTIVGKYLSKVRGRFYWFFGFTHGVQMGRQEVGLVAGRSLFGQTWKSVRCRKLILGRSIG